MSDPSDRKMAPILLAIGAVIGIGLALIGTFRPSGNFGSTTPPGVVAIVNGTAITVEEYGRALASFESSRREPPREEDRAYILDRLIEEELLIQRGVDIGLADNDRSVRSAIVRSMIDTIVAESTAQAITDEELQAYFYENLPLFTQAPSLHVRVLRFQSQGAAATAFDLLRRGTPFDDIASKADFTIDPVVPDTQLPPHKLREYIGPSALESALSLEPNTSSEPLEINGQPAILHLVAMEKAVPPAFSDVKSQVEFAFRTNRDDEALRDYLQRLMRNAEITRADLDDIIE